MDVGNIINGLSFVQVLNSLINGLMLFDKFKISMVFLEISAKTET